MKLRYKCADCSRLWEWSKLKGRSPVPPPPFGACPECDGICELEPILDKEKAESETLDAMDRARRGTDAGWAIACLDSIYRTCGEYATFTSDELWVVFVREHGNYAVEGTRNLSSLGPLLTHAAGLGWISPTHAFQESQRPERHKQPLRVWESLL